MIFQPWTLKNHGLKFIVLLQQRRTKLKPVFTRRARCCLPGISSTRPGKGEKETGRKGSKGKGRTRATREGIDGRKEIRGK